MAVAQAGHTPECTACASEAQPSRVQGYKLQGTMHVGTWQTPPLLEGNHGICISATSCATLSDSRPHIWYQLCDNRIYSDITTCPVDGVLSFILSSVWHMELPKLYMLAALELVTKNWNEGVE